MHRNNYKLNEWRLVLLAKCQKLVECLYKKVELLPNVKAVIERRRLRLIKMGSSELEDSFLIINITCQLFQRRLIELCQVNLLLMLKMKILRIILS